MTRQIHEVSREKNAAGGPEYEAWIHIAWDAKKSEYAVLWLNNTAVFTFAADGIGHANPTATGSRYCLRIPTAAAFTRRSVTTARWTDGRGRSTTLTRRASVSVEVLERNHPTMQVTANKGDILWLGAAVNRMTPEMTPSETVVDDFSWEDLRDHSTIFEPDVRQHLSESTVVAPV